jgi:hypothetical protein
MSQPLGIPHGEEDLREIPLRDVLKWSGLTAQARGRQLSSTGRKTQYRGHRKALFDNKAETGGEGVIDFRQLSRCIQVCAFEPCIAHDFSLSCAVVTRPDTTPVSS